jgi:hypothetical protein
MLPVLVVMMSITSCGDYLDINTDPNNPLQAKLSLVVPTVETAVFEAFGPGAGGLSDITLQFVHQTAQRGQSNFYFIGGDEFSIANAWNNLYAGALMDIEQIIAAANERESWHYLGLAQVLKAYTFSMIVDVWGNAAFSEFGQGTANPYAKYDKGQDIYPQLFALLNEATTNLAKTSQETVGAEDVVFGGSKPAWIAFANSLKLKLYNQVRDTNLYDAAAVADIINNKPMIASVAGGFRLLYGTSTTPENRHPLYRKDYIDANANYIDPYFWLIMKGDFAGYDVPVMNDVLLGVEDPRIPFYFYNQLKPGEAPQNDQTTTAYFDDAFLSIWFASFNIDPNEGFDQAQSQTLVGLYPAGGAYDNGTAVTAGAAAGQNPGNGGAGYQRLYPYLAHLYTRAELSLMKGAPGNVNDLFAAALDASFAEVDALVASAAGITDAQKTAWTNGKAAYLTEVKGRFNALATNEEKLELLLTEKWIASFGFGMDSYTDYRRTGYPVMFNAATDDNPYTILNRAYPVSFPYFIDDLQINPNADAQRNPGSDKVFWDIN